MASPAVLEFEALLAPIPGEQAVGRDPRTDTTPYPIYHQIRDIRAKARRAEREAAPAGDIEGEILASDAASAWQQVLTLSQQVLREQAKDVETISYLAEALLRRHGFAGLRDCFRLARLLVDLYWNELYPRATDESENAVEVRVKPLSDLNGVEREGTLIEPLRRVPITAGVDPGPFGLWQYQNATGVRQNADLLEKIKTSARASPIEFYNNLTEDLDACATEYKSLIQSITNLCGDLAPYSSRILSVLEDIRTAVRFITSDITGLQAMGAEPNQASAAATGMPPGDPASPATASGGEGPPGTGAVRGREEAFGALLHIARYFRQTEPHSPISYTLEELVRRGRLPFIELLDELVPDGETRSNILLRAGIAPLREQDQRTDE